MSWSGEVIGHLGVLSSPLAACYAARLFSRLAKRLEEATSDSDQTRQAHQSCTSSITAINGETQGLAGPTIAPVEVLQYCNAAFGRQSGSECSTSPADSFDEDLGFCILTPHQALDALGGHAPHYTKIYLNGLPFEADTEFGTVFSMDEAADGIQAVVEQPCELSTADDTTASDCPCASPTAELEELPSCRPPSAACSALSSCRSIASEFTISSSLESLASDRSSFDADTSGQFSPLPQRHRLSSPTGNSPLCSPFSGASYARTVLVDCASYQGEPSSCNAEAAFGPTMHISAGNGPSTSTVDLIGRPITPRKADESGCVFERSASQTIYIRPVSRSLAYHEAPKQHWMLSGAPASPPPPSLPSPVPLSSVVLTHVDIIGSCPAERLASHASAEVGASLISSEGVPAAVRQGSGPVRLPSQQSCSLAALDAAAPVGLHRAPALPLPPDGSADDSTVPPALRYYLAQARAAGSFDESEEEGMGRRRSSSSGSCRSVDGSADAIQPGYVRATVEQLNSQGVVCCHVTPFASTKTCSKTRSLGRGVEEV